MGSERQRRSYTPLGVAGSQGGARPSTVPVTIVLPSRALLCQKYYLTIDYMTRSRGFTFTCNNYTDDDIAYAMNLEYEADYTIIAFEVGESGTPHLQGYTYFKNPRQFKAVTKLLPKFHIEQQKGTKIEALTYCMKDGEYIEYGDRPQQGKRSDLDAIKYDLKYGKKTMKDVADTYFARWCQYNRSFDKYVEMNRSYETKLIQYDKICEAAYDYIYKLPNKQIYMDSYNPVAALHDLYSKKYEYVCLPMDRHYPDIIYKKTLLYIDDSFFRTTEFDEKKTK